MAAQLALSKMQAGTKPEIPLSFAAMQIEERLNMGKIGLIKKTEIFIETGFSSLTFEYQLVIDPPLILVPKSNFND